MCSKVKISQGYDSSLATKKHGVTGNLKKKITSGSCLQLTWEGEAGRSLELRSFGRERDSIFKQMSELGTEGKY